MSARQINLGGLKIGAGAPILVQGMTNTDTRNSEATLEQISRMANLGCEAVRVAVPDYAALAELPLIVAKAGMPVIADIHFDAALAVGAIEAGCAGIRINPGNIGSWQKVAQIVHACKANGAALRIGVNSGSLEKGVLARHGHASADALAESALHFTTEIEKLGFENMKVSLKSSSVQTSIEACRIFHKICDYPLHIGITESGSLFRGSIKSAVGLGILLNEGIGDTMRVSLTAPPEQEIIAAWEILRALGLRKRGPEIVSCPTCGRTEINLFEFSEKVEKALAGSTANIKVAVMGCPVNGPGEARDADIGLAGGRDKGIIFRKGKIVAHARGQTELLALFMAELNKTLKEMENE